MTRIQSGGQSVNLANTDNEKSADQSTTDADGSQTAAQQSNATGQQGEFKDSAAAAKQAAILNDTDGGAQAFLQNDNTATSTQSSADALVITTNTSDGTGVKGTEGVEASLRNGSPDHPWPLGHIIHQDSGNSYRVIDRKSFSDSWNYTIERVIFKDESSPEEENLPYDVESQCDCDHPIDAPITMWGTLNYSKETGELNSGRMHLLVNGSELLPGIDYPDSGKTNPHMTPELQEIYDQEKVFQDLIEFDIESRGGGGNVDPIEPNDGETPGEGIANTHPDDIDIVGPGGGSSGGGPPRVSTGWVDGGGGAGGWGGAGGGGGAGGWGGGGTSVEDGIEENGPLSGDVSNGMPSV